MPLIPADLDRIISNVLALLVAYVLTLPIAVEREQHRHGPGLRTFPLVAVASCGYVLLAENVLESSARVLAGLLAGIGFIGGGAIFKTESDVRGLATATSLWTTAAVGAAVAFRRYEIAIVLALLDTLILEYRMPMRRWIHRLRSRGNSALERTEAAREQED